MARSHLTLAALATSAVPGLTVVGSGPLGLGATGDFDSALLRTATGDEVVVRVPTSQRAETEQARELIALSALTDGIRSRLPFSVPVVLGQTPAGDTRAVVSSYIAGFQVNAETLPGGDGVATSIGGAIAALHAVPGSFVGDVGLPVQSADDSRTEASSVVERAMATRLLPAAVGTRWTDAIGDDALWQFNPTVVNGTASAESFVIADHEVGQIVVGMIGWSGLRLSDPAHDLHWLSGAGEAADSVFAAYAAASSRTPDSRIRVRAMLYAELELARWLLHGKDAHDQSIVDDAVSMLDGLVEHVLGDVMNPLSQQTGPVLSVADVETLLQRTPRTSSSSGGTGMETDSYDRSEIENVLGGRSDADDDSADADGPGRDDVDAPEHAVSTPDAETGPIDILDGSLRSTLSDEERARRARASSRETVEFDTAAWSDRRTATGDVHADDITAVGGGDGHGQADPTAASQRDRSSSSE
ncbi:phosphotransferase family enzyme [Labedella gwakjiensis]|uniref:Macrolide 2'-phosphotransferase n=1 Tax=Labedella gwakjiensis TaxID=390269 RepID=A0A2P8H104_9MICO|nr:phosphotransferase [Labedella gwakjiensis]PSL39895.1 phosphotransferase family enzyme [Labedella gwakjiensis]RUQ85739.1 macrolide 2'-phosphotransferase [Labedella gwakjiensis]